MMFRDLKKFVVDSQTQQEQLQSWSIFKGLPFYIWDKEEHRKVYTGTNGRCCWNHQVGLPKKDGNDKPLYDYQRIIFDSLEACGNRHVWIKKATGLGVSEFMLRFMAWLCLKDTALSGSQMCIVTGPRI